jgi:hypothetical protein
MKRLIKTGLLWLSLTCCFFGCSNGVWKNKYLGEIPAIAAIYQEKIEALEQKTDKCHNLEKAYEYAVRAKNLSKEAEKKIGEAFDKLPKPIMIPVIQDHFEADFSNCEINLIAASQRTLTFEARVSTIHSNSLPDTMIFCAITDKGQSIKPLVLLSKSIAAAPQSPTIYSGFVTHPENFIHIEAFKIFDRSP